MGKNNRYSTDNSYRKSHKNIDGTWYHESFENHNHIKFMWDLEKYVLDNVLDGFINNPTHLDFACGSGRIISYLKDRTEQPIGVDLSASMLKKAINNNPELKFIQGDITKEDILLGKKFDLITAFRFFPNAEPELRKDALKKIFKLLKDDGLLVINNHKNKHLWRRLKKIFKSTAYSLDKNDLEALLEEMGFQVRNSYNVVVSPIELLLPSNKKAWHPLYGLLLRIEKAFIEPKMFSLFARNIIYVCKKNN